MTDVKRAEMEAYDALPKDIRDLIKETNYNPIDAYLDLCNGKKIGYVKAQIEKYK